MGKLGRQVGGLLWSACVLTACDKQSEALSGYEGAVVEVDAGERGTVKKKDEEASVAAMNGEDSEDGAKSDANSEAKTDSEADDTKSSEMSQSDNAAKPDEKQQIEDKTLVRIPFLATVNDMPLKCGERYQNVGVSRSSIELGDFRFYVHDVSFIDEEGNETPVKLDESSDFQLKYTKHDGSDGWLAMLDFAALESEACARRGTESTNTVITGRAPEGKYTGLAFVLGVPNELNHINGSVSPSPLNSYGMQWSWASGYRHMKLEVQPTTDGATKEVFYFHSGAVGCTSDDGAISGKYQCVSEMNSRIELPYQPGKQAVQADLARLFAVTDFSTGRGCMGTSSLTDELDGPNVQPKTGCAELWSTLGLKLGKSLTNVGEKLGTCEGDEDTTCKRNSDCGEDVSCIGYTEAVKAELPVSVAQSTFAGVMFDFKQSGEPGARLPVDELQDEVLLGWPHPDYQRDPELDVPALSLRNGKDSHPPDDARYGSNCATCHQESGPGKGRYVVAGTVVDAEGGVYQGGGVVQIGTGVGNRRGPWVHEIADKISDFVALFEIPIDAYGQFYATADQAETIDYTKENYFARVMGESGSCKSNTGKLVLNASGAAVPCKEDAQCSELRYTRAGQCQMADGTTMMESTGVLRTCATSDECNAEGATCNGVARDQVAVCDKLLNAMPTTAVGACNHCHGDGFRIHSQPTL